MRLRSRLTQASQKAGILNRELDFVERGARSQQQRLHANLVASSAALSDLHQTAEMATQRALAAERETARKRETEIHITKQIRAKEAERAKASAGRLHSSVKSHNNVPEQNDNDITKANLKLQAIQHQALSNLVFSLYSSHHLRFCGHLCTYNLVVF